MDGRFFLNNETNWEKENYAMCVDVTVMVDPAIDIINHFASVDVYTRKTFPNCKTEDVYTRFAALF